MFYIVFVIHCCDVPIQCLLRHADFSRRLELEIWENINL